MFSYSPDPATIYTEIFTYGKYAHMCLQSWGSTFCNQKEMRKKSWAKLNVVIELSTVISTFTILVKMNERIIEPICILIDCFHNYNMIECFLN